MFVSIWSPTYDVEKKIYTGSGMSVEAKLFWLFSENIGIGAVAFVSYNDCKPVAGATLSMMYGKL